MKNETPYNAGELRKFGSQNIMICGHIWWPVEKCNAYHIVEVNQYGEPKDGAQPRYEWDTSHGNWPVFVPKERLAA